MSRQIFFYWGMAIVLFGFVFGIAESYCFGWNPKPMSFAEVICDYISAVLIIIGGVLLILFLSKKDKPIFEYTYYYKVYNTWCSRAFGPKPEDVNHIYGRYTMQRETTYTKKEIEFGRNVIIKSHVFSDPDVSPKDVVFITKEEYEAGTGGDSKAIGYHWNRDSKEPIKNEYNN